MTNTITLKTLIKNAIEEASDSKPLGEEAAKNLTNAQRRRMAAMTRLKSYKNLQEGVESGRTKLKSYFNEIQKKYDAIVAKYGEDSKQAKAYMNKFYSEAEKKLIAKKKAMEQSDSNLLNEYAAKKPGFPIKKNNSKKETFVSKTSKVEKPEFVDFSKSTNIKDFVAFIKANVGENVKVTVSKNEAKKTITFEVESKPRLITLNLQGKIIKWSGVVGQDSFDDLYESFEIEKLG